MLSKFKSDPLFRWELAAYKFKSDLSFRWEFGGLLESFRGRRLHCVRVWCCEFFRVEELLQLATGKQPGSSRTSYPSTTVLTR